MAKTQRISSFDKTTARELGAQVTAEIAALCDRLGLKVEYRGGTLGTTSFDMKLAFAVVSKDGVAQTKEAEAFKKYQRMHGIPLSALGQPFLSKGKTFILRGYNPSAPKFPFVAEDEQGRTWKMTKHGVEREFLHGGKAAAPTVPASAGLRTSFAKGQKVMAKWKDGKMYGATYLKVGVRPGFHRVQFDDGSGVYGSNVVVAV